MSDTHYDILYITLKNGFSMIIDSTEQVGGNFQRLLNKCTELTRAGINATIF